MKNYIQYLQEFYEDIDFIFGDDIESDHIDDAYKMAKKFDIGILSDKDIYSVAISNNEVVGALWTSWMSEEFSFDVVVRDDFQGKGVGKRLVDIAIDTYNQDKEAYDEPVMKAYVVNKDKMVPMLLKKGFKVEKEYPDQTVMFKESLNKEYYLQEDSPTLRKILKRVW